MTIDYSHDYDEEWFYLGICWALSMFWDHTSEIMPSSSKIIFPKDKSRYSSYYISKPSFKVLYSFVTLEYGNQRRKDRDMKQGSWMSCLQSIGILHVSFFGL